MSRGIWWEPNATSVSQLRATLLGNGPFRGFSGKFRAACRSGLWYWRSHYAKLHFMRTAYYRYGYPFPRYHTEARSSALGFTRTINGITLRPSYSGKNVKQAQQGWLVTQGQDLPLVLSGNTRRGIMEGPFRTYGAGTRVIRGSWGGGQICWAWLAKVRLSGGLTEVIPQEKSQMFRHIESMFHVFMQESWNLDYRDEQLMQATGATTLPGGAL
jgi:hypothetical protein